MFLKDAVSFECQVKRVGYSCLLVEVNPKKPLKVLSADSW